MKKVVVSLMALLLVIIFILVGCSSPAQTPQAPLTSATTSATTSAKSPPSSPPISTPAGQTINLKFAHFSPTQAYLGKALEGWAQAVNDASNGKVKITVYPAGTLVKQQDEYDAVLSGMSDIQLFQPDITAGRFPLSGLDTLPMLFPSGEVLGSVYWDIAEKHYFNTDFSKVKVLWIQPMPPLQIFSKKPINTLADFKGLKWRAEGKVESWTMTALGASPAVIDLTEVYNALDKGLVDGINFLWEGALAFGFQQITKYRTESNLMGRGFMVVMNQEKWNSLPSEVKALFTKFGGKEYSTTAGANFDKAMQGAKQAIQGYDQKVGNPPVITLSPDEKAKWVAVCQTVGQQWAKEKDSAGLPGSAILSETQELIKKYAR